MIIDLRAEIEKRKTTPQKEEAIAMLEKAIEEIKEGNCEECIVMFKDDHKFRYFSNKGSQISFLGMLEIIKGAFQ